MYLPSWGTWRAWQHWLGSLTNRAPPSVQWWSRDGLPHPLPCRGSLPSRWGRSVATPGTHGSCPKPPLHKQLNKERKILVTQTYFMVVGQDSPVPRLPDLFNIAYVEKIGEPVGQHWKLGIGPGEEASCRMILLSAIYKCSCYCTTVKWLPKTWPMVVS